MGGPVKALGLFVFAHSKPNERPHDDREDDGCDPGPDEGCIGANQLALQLIANRFDTVGKT